MVNIASQLIEQYVATFMLTMFTSSFKFEGELILDKFKNDKNDKNDKNNKITVKRGIVHDFVVQFKNDEDNDTYNQVFEIKSYNKVFGNITLTTNQRKINNIGTPIYVLCNYDLNGNKVIITNVDLVLGSELSKYSIFNNDIAKSKHISKKVMRINIYNNKNKY